MNLKYISCIAIFFLCCCSASDAQQQFPTDTADTFEQYHPETYIALAGEGTVTNAGLGVSVPVFWVENRVKIMPLLGFFWEDFSENGFDFNPAFGAKALYYIQEQPFDHTQANSFYAGVGGMGSVTHFFGREITEQSRAGLIFGYDYALNQRVGIAPELHLGVNESGNFRPVVGLAIHFGK